MLRLWFKGLWSRRSGRLLGAMTGVALTVALLAALGAFIVSSAAAMTQRAIDSVPVDWQVQLNPGVDPQTILTALGQATAYTALEQVGYADTSGFEARTGQTVQTTGPGKVLGLPQSYRSSFPQQLRSLVGSPDGVLIAQQTAANLHVSVGDTVSIQRVGLAPAQVTIAGVVDLPNADAMFQALGVPPGAAPQAPPDNVVLLPLEQWQSLFAEQAAARPDSVRTQLHLNVAHDTLSANPSTAYVQVQARANNLEARVAGSATVANNLAARLDGARGDALYARVLFLFLGTPGAVLAALLSVAVAASGAERRRQEQALLRVRGASTAQLLQLAAVETAVVGLGGVLAGLALAYLASLTILGAGVGFGSSLPWLLSAALLGFILASSAVLWPAWRDAKETTVASARIVVGHARAPLWQRLYLDLICLAVAAAVFWQTAASGYQVVLAPEGVATTSVDYGAFVAPLFLWLGSGLLTMRLWHLGLGRGRPLLARSLRLIAGDLSGTVAASLSRQRGRVTRGVVLVALAVAFATSTALFNTTYNAQSRVDALLTNGADVTVTGSTAAPAGSELATLEALPGVVAAQAVQHRFAYVGNDLQDLFGIDPVRIGDATTLSNAYFQGGSVAQTLATLSHTPDGVLVSEETVRDFQLQLGDRLNLRLQNTADNQYHSVPFTFVGVAREFPTAPKDSFLVANAAYIAKQTGSDAAEVVLLRTSGTPGTVAAAATAAVASLPGAEVTDLEQTQQLISSSLTAVDLRGLTRLELSFAALMVAGATGLILALGLAERRRTFGILAALGAKRRQLNAFLWGEGLVIFLSGTLVGLLAGFGVADMLVKVLKGVFDPPPEVLAVPWLYLALVVVAAAVSMSLALVSSEASSRRSVVQALKEL